MGRHVQQSIGGNVRARKERTDVVENKHKKTDGPAAWLEATLR
jgi:hypothetical protein